MRQTKQTHSKRASLTHSRKCYHWPVFYSDNPERVLGYTQKISASAHHLLGLIDEVLEIVKRDRRKATLEQRNFQLGQTISQASMLVSAQAAKKAAF